MKRELLREPARILLDRGPETIVPPEKPATAEAARELRCK